jgi:hypothetical protein
MIFNVGMVKEEVPCGQTKRARPRTVERRINSVGAKGKGEGTQGYQAFRRAQRKLFEQLKQDVEDDGGCTCLLDAVADNEGFTLEAVGEIFNLTRERIRQIEVKGLIKLRRDVPMHSDLRGWEDHREDGRG